MEVLRAFQELFEARLKIVLCNMAASVEMSVEMEACLLLTIAYDYSLK